MNEMPQITEHLNSYTLNAFIDGELLPTERQGAEQHLTTCHACTLRVLSATQLKAATARAGHRFAPPPEALGRLAAQLRSQSQLQTKPQTQTNQQPQTKTPARLYSIRPAAWATLAAAILLTISLLSWRQLHQTNTLRPNSSTSTSPPSPVQPLHRSSLPTVTRSNPGSRAASPSASIFPTPRLYHLIPFSKERTLPTSTVSPRLCSSLPSTSTRFPSSSCNDLPTRPSPLCRAPAQASPSTPPTHQISASSPSVMSTQPTSTTS